MNFFETIFINPILNLLLAIHKIFDVVGAPGALGLSIIGLTVLVRVVLWPLTTKQLESAKKMAELRPKLEGLKERFGADKVRLQQEQLALYREHGVNPASGCLPLVLQIPIFIALYQVLIQLLSSQTNGTILEKINQVAYHPSLRLSGNLDTSFLGFNLGARPADWTHAGVILLFVPVLTGVLQFVQSKMMMPQKDSQKKKDGDKGKEKGEELMAAMQGQMTYLMPGMIALFSYTFPLGLSLYWNTFTVFGIIQQYFISGFGGLVDFVPHLKKYGRR